MRARRWEGGIERTGVEGSFTQLKLFVTEAKERAEGTRNNPTTGIGFGGAMNRHS